jgi:hypothetical protein
MTEDELRAVVRQAIAKVRHPPSHLAPSDAPPHPSHDSHPSHLIFTVPSGADQDGPCIIEPTVLCNHCGYCKSLGH